MNTLKHVLLLTFCSSFINVEAYNNARCYFTPKENYTCCAAQWWTNPYPGDCSFQSISLWEPGTQCPANGPADPNGCYHNNPTYYLNSICSDNFLVHTNPRLSPLAQVDTLASFCKDMAIMDGNVNSICVFPKGDSYMYLVFNYNNLGDPGKKVDVETEYADRTVTAREQLQGTGILNGINRVVEWTGTSKKENNIIQFSLQLSLSGKFRNKSNGWVISTWEMTKKSNGQTEKLDGKCMLMSHFNIYGKINYPTPAAWFDALPSY